LGCLHYQLTIQSTHLISIIATQGFALVQQVLYCLSHTSSPFCSDYFGDGIMLFVLASKNRDSSSLHFMLLLGLQHEPPMPSNTQILMMHLSITT
jgi:hypothetical protein